MDLTVDGEVPVAIAGAFYLEGERAFPLDPGFHPGSLFQGQDPATGGVMVFQEDAGIVAVVVVLQVGRDPVHVAAGGEGQIRVGGGVEFAIATRLALGDTDQAVFGVAEIVVDAVIGQVPEKRSVPYSFAYFLQERECPLLIPANRSSVPSGCRATDHEERSGLDSPSTNPSSFVVPLGD